MLKILTHWWEAMFLANARWVKSNQKSHYNNVYSKTEHFFLAHWVLEETFLGVNQFAANYKVGKNTQVYEWSDKDFPLVFYFQHTSCNTFYELHSDWNVQVTGGGHPGPCWEVRLFWVRASSLPLLPVCFAKVGKTCRSPLCPGHTKIGLMGKMTNKCIS